MREAAVAEWTIPSPSPVAFVPVPDGREVAVAQSWQNELEVSAAMTVVASLLAGGAPGGDLAYLAENMPNGISTAHASATSPF